MFYTGIFSPAFPAPTHLTPQVYFSDLNDMGSYYASLNNQGVWEAIMIPLGLPCASEGSYTDLLWQSGGGGIIKTGVIAVIAGAPVAGMPTQLLVPGTPCNWSMSSIGCAPPPPPPPPLPPPPPPPPQMACTINAYINKTSGPIIGMDNPCALFMYFFMSQYANGVNVGSHRSWGI